MVVLHVSLPITNLLNNQLLFLFTKLFHPDISCSTEKQFFFFKMHQQEVKRANIWLSVDGFRVLLWELLSIFNMWIFIIFLCANARQGQNCLRTTDASIEFSVELTQRHSHWFLVFLSNLNCLYEIRFNNLCSPITTSTLGFNNILKVITWTGHV